ncbi:MAG: hypothetical protein U9Q71_08595 [Pseudomonadota bacterium]|nr:hypothetical protein [Pseudomonadota bacterium]
MKKPVKTVVLGFSAMGLLAVDISPQSTFVLGFVPEAAARFGRPLTPVSFAGVARRTTRRAVVVGSAAAATTAVVATPTTVVVSTPPPPPPPSASVPIGTVVTTLPAGCTVTAIGGVEYHECAGVYYRAAIQGNNLVYMVTQP